MTVKQVGSGLAWALMTLLSVGVGGYALFHVATAFQHVPPPLLNGGFPSPLGLQTHIAASGVAMLVGAFQFNAWIRTRARPLHRWTGRVYAVACIVGGLSGGAIALFSSSGPVAGWGFFILAVLWVPFTAMGWISATKRDFLAHERWMIRSFALTFGAVTLRIYLPIGSMTVGFEVAYPIIAWIAWVPNLIVAEMWIASSRRLRPRVATAQAA